MSAAECDCVMEGDTPAEVDRCGAKLWDSEREQEWICTKPDGHDGPHSSCNVAQHPAKVWEQ